MLIASHQERLSGLHHSCAGHSSGRWACLGFRLGPQLPESRACSHHSPYHGVSQTGAPMERLRQLIHEIHRRGLWQVLGVNKVGGRTDMDALRTLLFFSLSVLLVGACGGDQSTTPEVAHIVALEVQPDAITLDRWGDTVRLVVRGLDAGGSFVSAIPAMWRTSDSTVADVDSDGVVSSWLAGDAILTAAITPQDPGLPSSITVAVTVAIQRNPLCVVPTEFPLQPPVGPAPVWGEVPNAFAGLS